jgi:two-component system, LytTR family, response regulator
MLRVAVVDDEHLARQATRHLLAAHPDLELIAEADSIEGALSMIRQDKPDGIFLDVRLPGGTGFDLLGALDAPPKIVMVTAHGKHAVQAFEVDVVDYLLKPVPPARFAQAVQRLQVACARGPEASPAPAFLLDDYLCLRTPQQIVTVRAKDVLALRAEGDFTHILVKNSPPLMVCLPLGHYQSLLPSPPFVRLDRSLIINLRTPLRLRSQSRDAAALILEGADQEILLGRTARQRLQEHLPSL